MYSLHMHVQIERKVLGVNNNLWISFVVDGRWTRMKKKIRKKREEKIQWENREVEWGVGIDAKRHTEKEKIGKMTKNVFI